METSWSALLCFALFEYRTFLKVERGTSIQCKYKRYLSIKITKYNLIFESYLIIRKSPIKITECIKLYACAYMTTLE